MGALLETGEGSSAAEEDFRQAGIKRAVVTKLFEMKFGKGSGENLNLCMDSATSQGAKLLQEAGLQPTALAQDFKAHKHNAKAQVRIFRTVATAFMAHHGATIAEHGLEKLGLGACGKVVCAGNLRYAMDKSGLHRCEWDCPVAYLPDTWCADVVCLLIFDVNSLKHRVAVCIWLAPEGGACHVFRAWFPSSNSFGVFSHSEGFKAKLHIAHARDERCKDTLAAVNVSGYSGPGLDETVDLNTKLIDQLEEEEEQMTAASEAIENSGLWRMMKKVKVETEDVLLPVPSHYKLVKMPDAKQVSLDFKAATSMYYQGTCIPQEAYLAKHTVARVSQKNYKNIPVGDVVKIERVVRSLDPKDPTNVFVRHGGLQKRMRLQDLSFDA
eukprot:symbB.v1.2.037576.t1/scaffold5589.1/size25556/2